MKRHHTLWLLLSVAAALLLLIVLLNTGMGKEHYSQPLMDKVVKNPKDNKYYELVDKVWPVSTELKDQLVGTAYANYTGALTFWDKFLKEAGHTEYFHLYNSWKHRDITFQNWVTGHLTGTFTYDQAKLGLTGLKTLIDDALKSRQQMNKLTITKIKEYGPFPIPPEKQSDFFALYGYAVLDHQLLYRYPESYRNGAVATGNPTFALDQTWYGWSYLPDRMNALSIAFDKTRTDPLDGRENPSHCMHLMYEGYKCMYKSYAYGDEKYIPRADGHPAYIPNIYALCRFYLDTRMKINNLAEVAVVYKKYHDEYHYKLLHNTSSNTNLLYLKYPFADQTLVASWTPTTTAAPIPAPAPVSAPAPAATQIPAAGTPAPSGSLIGNVVTQVPSQTELDSKVTVSNIKSDSFDLDVRLPIIDNYTKFNILVYTLPGGQLSNQNSKVQRLAGTETNTKYSVRLSPEILQNITPDLMVVIQSQVPNSREHEKTITVKKQFTVPKPSASATDSQCINSVKSTGFIPKVTWGSTPEELRDSSCDDKICKYYKDTYVSRQDADKALGQQFVHSLNYCETSGLLVWPTTTTVPPPSINNASLKGDTVAADGFTIILGGVSNVGDRTITAKWEKSDKSAGGGAASGKMVKTNYGDYEYRISGGLEPNTSYDVSVEISNFKTEQIPKITVKTDALPVRKDPTSYRVCRSSAGHLVGQTDDDSNLRLYTRDECTDLGGIYLGDKKNGRGECLRKEGGSYSFECRNEPDPSETTTFENSSADPFGKGLSSLLSFFPGKKTFEKTYQGEINPLIEQFEDIAIYNIGIETDADSKYIPNTGTFVKTEADGSLRMTTTAVAGTTYKAQVKNGKISFITQYGRYITSATQNIEQGFITGSGLVLTNWEQFTLKQTDKGYFTIKTQGGKYLSPDSSGTGVGAQRSQPTTSDQFVFIKNPSQNVDSDGTLKLAPKKIKVQKKADDQSFQKDPKNSVVSGGENGRDYQGQITTPGSPMCFWNQKMNKFISARTDGSVTLESKCKDNEIFDSKLQTNGRYAFRAKSGKYLSVRSNGDCFADAVSIVPSTLFTPYASKIYRNQVCFLASNDNYLSISGSKVTASIKDPRETESFVLIEDPGKNIGPNFPDDKQPIVLPDMTCDEYKKTSDGIFAKLDDTCKNEESIGTAACKTNLEKALVAFFLGDKCANEYYEMETGGNTWSKACKEKNIEADLNRYNNAVDKGTCEWNPKFEDPYQTLGGPTSGGKTAGTGMGGMGGGGMDGMGGMDGGGMDGMGGIYGGGMDGGGMGGGGMGGGGGTNPWPTEPPVDWPIEIPYPPQKPVTWPVGCPWPLSSSTKPDCWPIGTPWPPQPPAGWPPTVQFPPVIGPGGQVTTTGGNTTTTGGTTNTYNYGSTGAPGGPGVSKGKSITYNIYNGYGGWEGTSQESNWSPIQSYTAPQKAYGSSGGCPFMNSCPMSQAPPSPCSSMACPSNNGSSDKYVLKSSLVPQPSSKPQQNQSSTAPGDKDTYYPRKL